MGVYIQDITPELNESMGLNLKDTKGALVTDVTKGGPADKAGLKSKDVVIAFDGKEVKDSTELRLIVSSTPVDKVAKVDVLRKGEKKTFDLKVGELQETEEVQDASSPRLQGRGGSSENQLNQLGFSVGDITADRARQYNLTEKSGVVILQVQNNSQAARAGLSAGMVIVEMDNEEITDLNHFNRKISTYKAGDIIVFKVRSGEGSLFLTLKVEK